MTDFHWFMVGMGLMGLVLIGAEYFWNWFENKRMKPISVKKPRPHVLGIIDTSEKSK